MNFVAKALNLSISAAERLEERSIIRKAFIKHPFKISLKLSDWTKNLV